MRSALAMQTRGPATGCATRHGEGPNTASYSLNSAVTASAMYGVQLIRSCQIHMWSGHRNVPYMAWMEMFERLNKQHKRIRGRAELLTPARSVNPCSSGTSHRRWFLITARRDPYFHCADAPHLLETRAIPVAPEYHGSECRARHIGWGG